VAFGRSRGGFSTKIHAAVNGEGQPIRLVLTGGECHDVTQAETLLADLPAENVVGDKAYDSDALRRQIRRQGGKPVIPTRKGTRRRRYDKTKYKLRNVIERFFNRIKHYRRVATRYEKTDPNFLGFLCLASLLSCIVNVNTI
jgi:transposase